MEFPKRNTRKELERRLKLINDDIQVAEETAKNLERSNKELQEKIEDETFQLEEIRSKFEEDEEEEEVEKNDEEPVKESFFGILTQLESMEANILAQIEEFKTQSREISHEYTAQVQRRKQLRAKLESNKQKQEIQTDQRVKLQSDYDVADQESIRLQGVIDELTESSYNLNEENMMHLGTLNKRNKTLMAELENRLQYLNDNDEEEESAKSDRDEENDEEEDDVFVAEKKSIDLQKKIEETFSTKKRELLERRSELVDELDALEKQYKRQQEILEERRKNAEREKKMATSIGSWLATRSILLDKIKRKRTEMNRKASTLEREGKMTEDLKRKFIKMFGNDDPGDGTGPLAKTMVQAELDSTSKQEERNASLQEEINIEKEYNETLHDTLNQLENSIKILEEHKAASLKALDEEMEECNQDGYLVLLQAERDDLKVKYSK